ncbi:MAG: DNA cytosine methyltransferase [Acinetobacter sp.]|nr:MAG: DNA cytosine methyltransferase [Acinetobacter sp.]
MKVLDTFAGAGGFSLGFSMNPKFEIVGAIEIDKWAAETFKFNHPEVPILVKDISKLSDIELVNAFTGKIDLILGGPPCQGFSIANRKSGDPTDPRNSLFKDFVRLGKLFNPEVMIMENVPNLVKAKTHNGELVLDIIKKELLELGYFVYDTILHATNYGVPQIRKRLIIIASKIELKNPFPKPTHCLGREEINLFADSGLLECPTLWDAISDLPVINACEGAEVMDYNIPPQTKYQLAMRNGSSFVNNHKAMKHSKRMVERFESMVSGESSADVAEHLKPLKRNGNGEISNKVYDQNNRRMFADRPCHTIAASFYANFVHPFQNRNFTPREGARIQSFPDTYIFKGKPTVVSQSLLSKEGRIDEKHLGQYNQIGNAVPPLLAKAIADNLIEQLKESKRECTYTETI